MPPFYRARLNHYHTLTAGDDSDDRLGNATYFINQATQQCTIETADDIAEWQMHINSTRAAMVPTGPGGPMVHPVPAYPLELDVLRSSRHMPPPPSSPDNPGLCPEGTDEVKSGEAIAKVESADGAERPERSERTETPKKARG